MSLSLFEEWLEEELLEMKVSEMLEPMETTYCEEGELALGLAIVTPESCAPPLKAVCTQDHDMWGKALPSNILKDNFGPTHCSTPRMIFRTSLKALGAVTPPTQLVFASPAKTPSLGLANANPNQSNFQECKGRSGIETEEVESIHTFETTTSILTANATTTTL